MKGHVFCPSAFRRLAFLLLLISASAVLPLMADGTNAAPVHPAGTSGEDFGQYLADHQDDLAPFFTQYSGDIFKQIVPLAISLFGWVILLTMLLGWVIDVFLSRGLAFFFAPAYAEWKRSLIYATGRLFLSFLYTGLMGLGIVFSLGLSQAGIIISAVVSLLLVVAFAAQIVWVLYLYRTSFGLSIGFYIALLVLHTIAGALLAGPLLNASAPIAVTNFFDTAITPKLRAEIESARHELAAAKADRDAVKAKATEFQNQIAQAQSEQDRLRQEIVEKKNSDVYVIAQIIKVRANGDLTAARDQLAAFPAKFPSSPLDALARAQLDDVDNQIAMVELQQKQQEAEAARDAALARADLLDRASKGEVTLSEMRQALLNKTRAQVKEFLGAPSDIGSDSWGYRQQMIVNPLTNERHGLVVYFNQGLVQSVDYDLYGESR
jgi:hypothetical protein